MKNLPIVEVNNLSKIYRVYNKPQDRLKELLSLNNKTYAFITKAIDNISFSIEKGDRLGILGENGSGKTTLLKMLSHVLTPTNGTYYVRGKISSLLELGTGFNPELTGKENFYQNGMVYGYEKKELGERFNLVHEFSELGNFIDHPVKSYSSGMFLRLAFSCAVFVDPDILIIDEALSVGDIYFQNKCYQKIKSLIDHGTTFIYVSHNPDSTKSLCNKGIMLRKGKIEQIGEAEHVSNHYTKYLYEKQNKSTWWIEESEKSENEHTNIQTLGYEKKSKTKKESKKNIAFKISKNFKNRIAQFRCGTGYAVITEVELFNSIGEITKEIRYRDKVAIRVYIEFYAAPKDNLSLGVGLRDSNGIEIIQFTTLTEGVKLGSKNCRREIIELKFENKLIPGDYSIAVGLAELVPSINWSPYYEIEVIVDYCPGCYQFKVSRNIEKPIWGKVGVPVVIDKYSI
jgi:lipopolysaccharide transport system ATP-binding protein